jgi:hypothetical protein
MVSHRILALFPVFSFTTYPLSENRGVFLRRFATVSAVFQACFAMLRHYEQIYGRLSHWLLLN